MKSIVLVPIIIVCSLSAVLGQEAIKLRTTIKLNGEIGSLAFSPDGTTLATTVGEKTEVRLWDTNTGVLKARLSGNDDPIRRSPVEGLSIPSHFRGGSSYFAFSPDGRFLAEAALMGRELRVWRLDTYERYITYGPLNDMKQLNFSPDSSLLALALGEQGLKLLDLYTKKLLNIQYDLRRAKSVYSAAFSEKSEMLMVWIESLDKNNTGTHYIELKTGRAMVRPSPRGLYDVSSDGRRWAVVNDNNEVEITNPFGKIAIATIRDLKARVRQLRFSPDNKTIAIQCDDNSLKLWDSASGNLKTTVDVTEKVHMAFSRSGNLLLTGGAHEFKLWDAQDGTLRGTLNDALLTATSFDGKLLATAGKKNTVFLWEVPAHG